MEATRVTKSDWIIFCSVWSGTRSIISRKNKERIEKNAAIASFVSESSATMLGYVPVNISQQTEVSLHHAGLSQQLPKRIFNKKCLWLIRMSPDEISRLHEADLLNRYSPEAMKLDLVELAAIYGSLPAVFLNDVTGRKQEVRVRLEDNIHSLLAEKNKLVSATGDKFRHRLYRDCPPPFHSDPRFMAREVVLSADGGANDHQIVVNQIVVVKKLW